MSALKDHVSAQMVQDLAAQLTSAWPVFPTDAFVDDATNGLEDLELKDRIHQVATSLARALPDEPTDLVAVLDATLRLPSFEGWMVWPCAEMLTPIGPVHPDIILPFMARLTHRSSCEFAIRPCIDQHPELTFAYLHTWVSDPDEHGHPTALQLVGYDADAPVHLEHVTIDPSHLPIGGHAQIGVELTTESTTPVPIVVEYLIHYLGIRGPRKPKAYRLAERTLEPGVPCRLRRKQTFKHASIRALNPGDHLIEIQVNGRVLGSCTLDLTP